MRTAASKPNPQRKALRHEERALKTPGKKALQDTLRDNKALLGDVKGIREAVRKYGQDPAARATILKAMETLPVKEEAVWKDLQRLKTLNDRLTALDVSLLREDRHGAQQAATADAQAAWKKRVRNELAKLQTEQRISRIDKALRDQLESFTLHLNQAARYLHAGQVPESLQALDTALRNGPATQRLAETIKSLEKRLLRLTRLGERVEK